MESTQSLVLARLEEYITEGGLTPVQNSDYGNTGYVLALTDNLDVVTSIHYDFQATYFALKVYRGNVVRSGGTADAIFTATTINGKPTSEVLAQVAEYLADDE